MSNPRFVVAGAGLGGALMAINLGRAGYEVEVLERRRDPRAAGGHEGRSINLAISKRGIDALKEAGVADEVLATAVPMRGRMMHSVEGKLSFQPYGTRPDHVINSVSRTGLNIMLLNAAESLPNVSLTFEQQVRDVDLNSGAVTVTAGSDNTPRTVAADVVVGADGAFSAIRQRMARLDRFDFSQSYLSHGYKELTIPPADDGGFKLYENALHIWPRGGFMMIALPNRDGSFTCTLFWPWDGPNSFAAVQSEKDAASFFDRWFPDAVQHIPTLPSDYVNSPTSSLMTVRSGPWYHENRVVLLGDACHAVVPFYGQGANAAFEDCLVLSESLKKHGEDWGSAFEEYYETRKTHIDVLADLALNNFVEMRDHVASPTFRLHKKMENVFQRLFSGWYIPLYSMVSFSRIPYGDAVTRSRRQSAVIKYVLMVSVALLVAIGVLLWS